LTRHSAEAGKTDTWGSTASTAVNSNTAQPEIHLVYSKVEPVIMIREVIQVTQEFVTFIATI